MLMAVKQVLNAKRALFQGKGAKLQQEGFPRVPCLDYAGRTTWLSVIQERIETWALRGQPNVSRTKHASNSDDF